MLVVFRKYKQKSKNATSKIILFGFCDLIATVVMHSLTATRAHLGAQLFEVFDGKMAILFTICCKHNAGEIVMIAISTTELRKNLKKYLNLVTREKIVVRSTRNGSFDS